MFHPQLIFISGYRQRHGSELGWTPWMRPFPSQAQPWSGLGISDPSSPGSDLCPHGHAVWPSTTSNPSTGIPAPGVTLSPPAAQTKLLQWGLQCTDKPGHLLLPGQLGKPGWELGSLYAMMACAPHFLLTLLCTQQSALSSVDPLGCNRVKAVNDTYIEPVLLTVWLMSQREAEL